MRLTPGTQEGHVIITTVINTHRPLLTNSKYVCGQTPYEWNRFNTTEAGDLAFHKCMSLDPLLPTPRPHVWACTCCRWAAMCCQRNATDSHNSCWRQAGGKGRREAPHPHPQPHSPPSVFFSDTYSCQNLEVANVQTWPTVCLLQVTC